MRRERNTGAGYTQHETRARDSPPRPPTCLCFLPGHILGWSRGGGRRRRAAAMPLSILTFPQCHPSEPLRGRVAVVHSPAIPEHFLPSKTALLDSVSIHARATQRRGGGEEGGRLLCCHFILRTPQLLPAWVVYWDHFQTPR